jgi:hypothetical protein
MLNAPADLEARAPVPSPAPLRKTNVLIFPAGAENALEIHASLRHSVHFKVYGGSSVEDHARFAYENYIGGMPRISDLSFLSALNDIIRQHDIRLIFPTHDTVALFMAEHRDQIHALIVAADAPTALVCREKRRTYALFQDEDFCPALFADPQAPPRFPVFVKPNIAEGGRGAQRVDSVEGLAAVTAGDPDLLICEWLPGEEYTIDCFTDRRGQLLFVGPRSRGRVRMGISLASHTVPLTEEISAIARRINERLKFRGLWFFQLKRASDGRLKLLEVSTRLAGAMSLYRQLGVNFSLLSAFDALDQDVSVLVNDLPVAVDRCLLARYRIDYAYDTVFIDYDDTIVHQGQVNTLVMRFLYQCANRGVRLVLVTRHAGDLLAHMRAHRIAAELFDDIRHLQPGELKSAHVRGPRAVFIDNHFPERIDVKTRCDVPAFDVDAVEGLLNASWGGGLGSGLGPVSPWRSGAPSLLGSVDGERHASAS